MTQLHKVGTRLSAIGRCAFVGMLVGMLAAQAVAEGAPITTSQSPAKPRRQVFRADRKRNRSTLRRRPTFRS
ncbi:MAG: hypothetical protein WDM87_16955 [Terracidiphilus sp.]